jgi:DNA repair ATPase RecN
MSQKSVKLKSIHFANYKAIDSLSAEIGGNHFIVVGHNSAGKTSVLEAINRSSTRLAASEVAKLPIKIGAKNATTGVVFVVDEDGKKREILVETTFRPSGGIMKVIDLANDGELKPPVEKIKQIIGESYDLSPLLDMEGKDQFKELLKILGGSTAISNFELEYDRLFDERKLVKRSIKEAEARIVTHEPPPGVLQQHKATGIYTEKKNSLEYPKQPDKLTPNLELNNANSKNEKIDRALEEKINIEAQIRELERQLDEKRIRLEAAVKWLEENPKIETEPIQAKIDSLDEDEEKWKKEMQDIRDYDLMVDRIGVYKMEREALDAKEKERDEIQKKMDKLSDQMKEAVTSLQIETIAPELRLMNEVDESGTKPVFLSGLYYVVDGKLLPFNRKQISYAKCLIALAKLSSVVNAGKFNFFHIPAWNDLDTTSKHELLEFAEENAELNIQFGIEEVKDEILGIKLIEQADK